MKECPHCDKLFMSYKSWHRHKTLSHPEYIKPLDWKSTEYNKNPKKCLVCETFMTWEQSHIGKFCSKSCNASFQNTQNQEAKTAAKKLTWSLKPQSNKPKRANYHKRKEPRLVQCVTCDITFFAKGSQKFCHPRCNPSKTAKVHYRNLCKFKMSPTTHASLYDFDLVESNGWYRPANHKNGYNPDGVTWDHLYRIEDGFRNGVCPSIMSHPANAEMVTWRDNQKRKTSQITLKELVERIFNWNS